jgi:hypothetical protein
MADTQLRVIASAVLACLCTAVNANPNPPLFCRYQIETDPPEDVAPDDLCCQGLAYVATGDLWPSTASFPDADVVRQVQGNCPPPAWGVEFRLGIMRCVPGTDLIPSTAEQQAAFLQDLDDAQALRAASCCVRTIPASVPWLIGFNVVVGRQSKTVQGGCVNRFVPVSFQFPNCETC